LQSKGGNFEEICHRACVAKSVIQKFLLHISCGKAWPPHFSLLPMLMASTQQLGGSGSLPPTEILYNSDALR